MPVWRPRPDWLRESVAAALSQRGCRIELIVVDDGSPEPTERHLAFVDEPRLRVVRTEHGGAAHARNVGIEASGGDFLRFIDSDDVIEAESTKVLLALTEGRDDVIAFGATMFCDQDLRPLWKMTSEVEGNGVEACLLGRFTTRPPAFLFPRRIVELAGGWSSDLTVSEDWDFVLRALEHGRVRGTNSVATLYRRHPGGTTADPTEGVRGAERVIARYFERHPDRRGTRLERKARARALAHGGRVYASHGHPAKGIARLARAAGMDPGALWVELAQAMPPALALGRRLLAMKPATVSEQPRTGELGGGAKYRK
jgi:glycosyltransferase involved in cell wall biosynthesis